MKRLCNRLVSAVRVLFVRRVLVIEAKYDKTRDRDRVTMWGTIDHKTDQIKLLRVLADSIDQEHQQEERERLINLSTQHN